MHEPATILPQCIAGGEAAKDVVPGRDVAQQDVYMESLQRLPIQRKLTVGAADDPLEKEADDMADKVMRMPETPFIQRKCAHCEEEEALQRKPAVSFIRRKGAGTGGAEAGTAVTKMIESTQGGGSSMTGATKSFMESRFGADFSGVNIHTGDYAAQLSDSLHARAFTVGNDIYFNNSMYAPGTMEGKHLLAHELTHVVQQSATIRRDEQVGEYHDSAFNHTSPYKTTEYIDDSTASSMSGYNYWYRKLSAIYGSPEVELGSSFPGLAGGEAWSAIFSKGWDLQPNPVPSAANSAVVSQSAMVPVVLGATIMTAGKPYRVHCLYSYRYDSGKKSPALKIVVQNFFAEPASIPDIENSPRVIAKKVSSDTTDLLMKASAYGFPGNNLKQYLDNHPEVKDLLAGYIEWRSGEIKKSKDNPSNPIVQLIRAKEISGGKENPVLLVLRLTATRDLGIFNITLNYAAEKNNSLGADYNKKDYADFRIEEDQQKHPGDTEKLGAINGLDAISDTNEKRIVRNLAVDFYISEKDKPGGKERTFRDTEVDQIIPITPDATDASKTESYYYTFIIHKADAAGIINIDVKRIGKKGDAVVGDPSVPLAMRIPGFAENAFDAAGAETPARLIRWLLARYKGVTEAEIKAATVKEISDKLNAIIAARCTTVDWFKKNYSINILDATHASTRLHSVHNVDTAALGGVKDFLPNELQMMELALQRMAPSFLKYLRNVSFARQVKVLIAGQPDLRGLTQTSSYTYTKSTNVITIPSSKTITLYDGAFKSNDSFLGGTEGVNLNTLDAITHEPGHVIGGTIIGGKHGNPTIQSIFNKFYKDLGLVPVTAYAKDTSNPTNHSPDTEYFPEAFMLFNNDPEWLLNNQHQTYLWFLLLQQTGNAPATDKVKSLISVWEQQKATGTDSSIGAAKSVYSLWSAYSSQAGKTPDADNTTTLVAVLAAFKTAKNRLMRTDEAAGVVTKWLQVVKKQKRQPTADEIKAFF